MDLLFRRNPESAPYDIGKYRHRCACRKQEPQEQLRHITPPKTSRRIYPVPCKQRGMVAARVVLIFILRKPYCLRNLRDCRIYFPPPLHLEVDYHLTVRRKRFRLHKAIGKVSFITGGNRHIQFPHNGQAGGILLLAFFHVRPHIAAYSHSKRVANAICRVLQKEILAYHDLAGSLRNAPPQEHILFIHGIPIADVTILYQQAGERRPFRQECGLVVPFHKHGFYARIIPHHAKPVCRDIHKLRIPIPANINLLLYHLVPETLRKNKQCT